MTPMSDNDLNRLLRQVYPAVEVSPDFTLRLWKKLMKGTPPWWRVPAPALAIAAAVGILAGWVSVSATAQTVSLERLDLFGNAPHDSMAGSVLDLMGGSAS